MGCLKKGDHLITSSYEHPAILKVCDYLNENQIEVSLVKPDQNGKIDVESVRSQIKDNTKMIFIIMI